MGFFDWLFRKRKYEPVSQEMPLFVPDEVQQLVKEYTRQATVLNPRKSTIPISHNLSKFGGIPNLGNFQAYPCCDVCKTPLNFVLQLYKADFPEHYFPENKDLFQLFRCPNGECPGAYNDDLQSDLKMFVYYFKNDPLVVSTIDMPAPNPLNMEVRIPDCSLTPEYVDDYAIYLEYQEKIEAIQVRHNNNLYNFNERFSPLFDLYLESYRPIMRTKTGGWPGYCQCPEYPVCKCGKEKEFFFQLSSDDNEEKEEIPHYDKWSPHKIMIGDVGNIYFYVCKSCGEGSIESNWDCH